MVEIPIRATLTHSTAALLLTTASNIIKIASRIASGGSPLERKVATRHSDTLPFQYDRGIPRMCSPM